MQRSKLQVTQLESALDVERAERRRVETEAIESRFASLDTARANLATANKLRRQFAEPVERLTQATCRLLEGALDADSKKLVESVLESALLLQSNLQELGNPVSAGEVKEASVTQLPEPPKEMAA